MFGDPSLPWSRAVAAGNFEIRDDADELLTADNWDERVRAGTSLRMFIILHLPIFPHCTPIGNFCPFCHYICDGWHRPVTEDSNGKQYWKPLFWYVKIIARLQCLIYH
jgi:hypothetical protein